MTRGGIRGKGRGSMGFLYIYEDFVKYRYIIYKYTGAELT